MRALVFLLLACGLLVPLGLHAEDVDLCHAPPGDPDLRRVIRVSPSAAERHLDRHEDSLFLGAEKCNALDDDCDGAVDESFPLLGQRCTEGLGVCAAEGHFACDPTDPSQARCDAEPLPPLEPGGERTCTGGRDEDCDGLVDADDPDCGFDIGRQLPSVVDLPVVIDCCDVAGPGCDGRSYCDVVQEPINPCPLSTGGTATCLEFSSVPAQNACWSVFDDASPSVDSPRMIEVLESGAVVAPLDEAFVDNGDKTVIIRRMHDLMYGFGPYSGVPAGVDRYPEVPGIDSWVVRLPVVECQDTTLCAGGDAQEMVGALCFEVREILSPPYDSDRIVKGRFLCPETDPHLSAECGLGPEFVD